MITVINKGAPITVVAFSGCAPRNSVFEWVQTFSLMACNFVGVRDDANDWYQTHREYIGERIANMAPTTKRLFIGASAGGFAALMFGHLLEADGVLAISPQSACGKAKRDLGDYRWPKWCEETPSCDIAGPYPNAVFHYAANDEFDVIHAKRLDCEHVVHPSGGHALPDVLKKAGQIGDIIAEAVARVA